MNFRTTALLLVVLAIVGGYLFFTNNSNTAPTTPPIETKNAQQLVDLVDGHAIRTFSGHSGPIDSVAFSPDGTEVLSGSDDKTLKLWDAASGREIHTLTGDTGSVTSVAFSPDGKTAASGNQDLTVKLWDLSSGQETRTLAAHTALVTHVAFSPDGTQLLSASQDKTLILWNVAVGSPLRTLKGHTAEVTGAAFSPDGKTAISSSNDGTLNLWDLSTGQVIRTFTAESPVTCVAISPDGNSAISGQTDGSIKLWTIASGQLSSTLSGHHGAVSAVAFSPDGKLALSGGPDGMKLWDVQSGQELRSFSGDIGAVQSVAFSPDGHLAISGSADNSIHLWDLARDVSKISITQVDGSKLELQRSLTPPAKQPISPASSTWELTAPVQVTADPFNTDDLLTAIIGATSNSQVQIGGDASAYGLDNPQFRIDLTPTMGGKAESIAIGRQVATGNELYARVDDQDVAQVIDGGLLDKLNTTADKLRQTKLLDVDTTAINSVTIIRPTHSLALTKTGTDWTMSEPGASDRSADGPLTNELLSSIDTMRANTFATPDADAARLIGRPQAAVTIQESSAATQPSTEPTAGTFATIEFSQPDLLGKTVWVRITPMNIVASIPKDTADSILKLPLDLINHDVMKIDPADVKKIEIDKSAAAGKTSTVLERRLPNPATKAMGPFTQPTTQPATPQTAWVLDSPKKGDADDSKVTSLLSQLDPLHVDKFRDNLPVSQSSLTLWTVTLTTAQGQSVVTLYDPGDSSSDPLVGVYQGQAFELPRTIISSLNVDFTPSAASSNPPPGP